MDCDSSEGKESHSSDSRKSFIIRMFALQILFDFFSFFPPSVVVINFISSKKSNSTFKFFFFFSQTHFLLLP